MKLPEINIVNEKYNPYQNFVIYPQEDVQYISSDNLLLIEADIKSAFPTFVKLFFKDLYPHVIEALENEHEKIRRNIIISTNMTKEIPKLQYFCKLFLISFLQHKLNLIEIIEFKKDGGIFIIPNIIDTFTTFKDDIYDEIIYKVSPLIKYTYIRNTSLYYYTDNSFNIKGKMKYLPLYIYSFYKGDLDKNFILDIYSDFFSELCKIEGNKEELSKLFICRSKDSEKKLLVRDNKYIDFYNISDIFTVTPLDYKRFFLEPYLKFYYRS